MCSQSLVDHSMTGICAGIWEASGILCSSWVYRLSGLRTSLGGTQVIHLYLDSNVTILGCSATNKQQYMEPSVVHHVTKQIGWTDSSPWTSNCSDRGGDSGDSSYWYSYFFLDLIS